MARKSRRNKEENGNLEELLVPEKERMGTAAYARLSVDTGDEDKIETQIALLHQFIADHPDLKLTDTYVDNGYSGTNFNRPEFNRLMEDVKTGRIHCIVVKDLSRFSRDFLETGYYLETVLPHLNVRFIAINDDFDSSREGDRENIAVPIKNIVNELYAKEASKKATLSFEISSQRGGRTIERSTFGYSVDRVHNVLVPNPETAPYVQIIFRWYLMGYTTVQIAKRLAMLQVGTPGYFKAMEEGTPVPDTDHWSHDKVNAILQNQTYAGDTVYGKRRKMLYKNVGEYHAKREDWVIHKGTHEALISCEDFEKVQEMTESASQRKKNQRERRKEEREKFTDYFPKKVCCMECGLTMTYTRYARSNSGKEYNGAVYLCKGNGVQKECKQKIHEDYLRILVMDQIRNLARTLCDRKALLKQMQTGECRNGAFIALRRKAADLSQKLSRTIEMRESLYEDLQENIIDSDEYLTMKEYYIQEEQKLKREIAEIDNKKEETARKIESCLELCEHLEEYLDRQELDEKISAEFVDKIIVSSTGKIEIRLACADVFDELMELTEGLQ